MFDSLRQGQAHLWRLSLDDFPMGQLREVGLSFLSEAERDRLVRASHPGFRTQFLAGRVLLRCVLSQYETRKPGDWEIAVSSSGKPWVPNGPPGVSVNLSHAQDLVVVLVARASSAGVDVESYSRRVDPLVAARPVFSSEEYEALQLTAPGPRRLEYFFRVWTIKESFVKAIGAGISDELRGVSFDVSGPAPRLQSTVPSLPAPGNAFFFYDHSYRGYLIGGSIFPDSPVSSILVQDGFSILHRVSGP